MAQTPIPPSTPDFTMMAAQSDQYEITAAEVAEAQSQNPAVRAFAGQMIQDHSRSADTLRHAAVSAGLASPPPAMSSDQASLLSALQSLRGGDFDQAYARQQVLAHHQALAVEQSYAASGANATLRSFAQTDSQVVQHHLEMAEQLRSGLPPS